MVCATRTIQAMDSKEVLLLEEAVKWLKFIGRNEAKDVVKDALEFKDKKKTRDAKIVYQLTNGQNSTKDIEKYISFSYRWVSTRHQEWANLGIVEKESQQSPYKHILPLDELGISYPDIPEPDTGDENQNEDEGAEGPKQASITDNTDD